MTGEPGGLSRALGGRATRRRRHRWVAAALAGVLVVAVVLILTGDDDGDDDAVEEAAALCATYSQRLQDEFELSFPEGAITAEAEAEYLSHAFVDTLDELVADLQALDLPEDADVAVEVLTSTSAALRTDPSLGIGADPFAAEVRPAFDAAGIEACGSEFLAATS